MPLSTRNAANPEAIKVSYMLRGEVRTDAIIADARPFGIERTLDGQRSYLFFPGIEADCASEPIDASDTNRSSLAKKFAAYLAIADQGLYRTHFGFPNFFVPFITTSDVRMRSMIELVMRLTQRRGSRIILFKTHPSFTSFEKPPAAGGHMLTTPWERAGFPPLFLDR